MITDMDKWTNIRRDILAGGMSRRDACKKYNLNFRTIRKILEHQEPPGYRRKATRVKPKIGKFIPIIHEILEADKKVHPKQRHTGKRIFERLCAEHGYTGKISVVRDAIRRRNQATSGFAGMNKAHRVQRMTQFGVSRFLASEWTADADSANCFDASASSSDAVSKSPRRFTEV